MQKERPRYVQGIFNNTLHERSVDRPLTRTLCGKDVGNFTRCTPADGFKLCRNCERIHAKAEERAAAS